MGKQPWLQTTACGVRIPGGPPNKGNSVMVSLMSSVFKTPTLKIGLGGNHYVICDTKEKLISICKSIDKSVNSIYYNDKYECWAIRIKSKAMKVKLNEVLFIF